MMHDEISRDLFLTRSEVIRLVRYSASQINRLEKAGSFPPRINLGPRKVVWREREVLAWLESRGHSYVD